MASVSEYEKVEAKQLYHRRCEPSSLVPFERDLRRPCEYASNAGSVRMLVPLDTILSVSIKHIPMYSRREHTRIARMSAGLGEAWNTVE